MKASFQFDNDSRSIILTPENDLERMIVGEIHERTEKGSQMRLSKVYREEGVETDFIVELKVNGH